MWEVSDDAVFYCYSFVFGLILGVLVGLTQNLKLEKYQFVTDKQFSCLVIVVLSTFLLRLLGISLFTVFILVNLSLLWGMVYLAVRYTRKLKRLVCVLHTLDELTVTETSFNNLDEKMEKLNTMMEKINDADINAIDEKCEKLNTMLTENRVANTVDIKVTNESHVPT